MNELLTAAQMRAIESAAIASGRATGLDLMERAGIGVVDAIFDTWPELGAAPRRAVVLCGPGNNGGDGYVIARLLHDRGWTVEAHYLGDPDALPPDARANYDRWQAIAPAKPLGERSLGTVSAPPDVVVDALFGTGLTRPVEGDAAFLLSNFDTLRNELGAKCVAVDLPSGICSDSGKTLGVSPGIDLIVTFHREKLGHRLEQGDARGRRIVVADIGLDTDDDDEENETAAIVRMVAGPPAEALSKSGHGQKYEFGHALILSGGAGRTGAARLAARGALRVGAGLVTLGVPPSATAEVAANVTAVMLAPVKSADALTEMLWDTRLNALCLGPALGLADAARDVVNAVLPLRRATVLDADALTMFSNRPDDLFRMTHDRCVLTPHNGEFARLFPELSAKLKAEPVKGPAYSRVDAARAAAEQSGCTILLKGPDTVIAGPDGRCAVHSAQYDRAAPDLATAGSGDVLAGFVTGLMARGFVPFEAACTAAWLHTECARAFGPGLIAEDLPETLPRVLRDLVAA